MDAHPFCHIELGVRDLDRARAFYSRVFGWKFREMPTPDGRYFTIDTGAQPGAGMMPVKQGQPVATTAYVMVDDIEAKLREAEAAGAKVLLRRTEIPGSGWFAMLVDPDGLTLGIYTPKTPPPPPTGELRAVGTPIPDLAATMLSVRPPRPSRDRKGAGKRKPARKKGGRKRR